MSAFRVGSAHISSAESWPGWEDCSWASAWAALVGDCGDDAPDSTSPTRRFLIASACRLGGPRRRLGRLKVHGMSRPTQPLQGGPDSSHCGEGQRRYYTRGDRRQTRLYFAYAARIAGFAQAVRLGLLWQRRIQRMIRLESLLRLEHLGDGLDLKARVLRVGCAWLLAVCDRRAMRVLAIL
jgi:hypothetical protein